MAATETMQCITCFMQHAVGGFENVM